MGSDKGRHSDSEGSRKKLTLWPTKEVAKMSKQVSSDTEILGAKRKDIESMILDRAHENLSFDNAELFDESEIGQISNIEPPPYNGHDKPRVSISDANDRVGGLGVNLPPPSLNTNEIMFQDALALGTAPPVADQPKTEGPIKRGVNKFIKHISPGKKNKDSKDHQTEQLNQISEEQLQRKIDILAKRKFQSALNKIMAENHQSGTDHFSEEEGYGTYGFSQTYFETSSGESAHDDHNGAYPDGDRENKRRIKERRSVLARERESRFMSTSREASPDKVYGSRRSQPYSFSYVRNTEDDHHNRSTRRSQPYSFNDTRRTGNGYHHRDDLLNDHLAHQHHNLLRNNDTVTVREVSETLENSQQAYADAIINRVLSMMTQPKNNLLGIKLPILASHQQVRHKKIDQMLNENWRFIERLNPGTGSFSAFIKNFHDTGLNSPEYNMYVHCFVSKDLQNMYQKRFPEDTPRTISTLHYLQNLHEIHQPSNSKGGSVLDDFIQYKPKSSQYNILDIYLDMVCLLNEADNNELTVSEKDKLLQSKITPLLPPHLQTLLQQAQTNIITGEKVFYSRSDLHSFLRAHTRVINQHLRDHKPHKIGVRQVEDDGYNDEYRVHKTNRMGNQPEYIPYPVFPYQFAAANNTSMFMPPRMDMPGPINISAPAGSAAPMSHPNMMNASAPPMDRAPGQFQSSAGRKHCTICRRNGHLAEQCYSCPKNGPANRANAPWCILCRSGAHKAPECTLYGPGQDFGAPPCGKCNKEPHNFMAYHLESKCKGVDENFRAIMSKYRANRRTRTFQQRSQKN